MLLVDPRTGSAQYLKLLTERGLKAQYQQLDAADIAFVGNGPDQIAVMVGIEIKKLGDLLRCIVDGRFAESQLPTLQEHYAAAWIVVEGIWKGNGEGRLVEWKAGRWQHIQWGRRGWHARDVEHWITTMEVKAGVRVRITSSEAETVRWVHSLWSWWCAQDWDEHTSHLSMYDRPLTERVMTHRPSLARKIAFQLPGVGWDRSKQVALGMGGVPCPKLCAWSVEEWAEIEGIGKKTAIKVWEALHGASASPLRDTETGVKRKGRIRVPRV